MVNGLSRGLTDAVVRRLAGEPSYQRGFDYFSHGHVESIKDEGGSVRAAVRGDQDYTVTLAADEGVLDYSCDCPVGADGSFCKHCVAAALAWLNRAAGPNKPARQGKARTIKLADAAKILQAEDKDTLVRMVLDWAKDDSRLRERLILYAARRSGPESAAAAVRLALEKSVRVRSFMSKRDVKAWVRGVGAAIDSVAQLLKDGQAGAVIELCESALLWLEDAGATLDESECDVSILSDRLQDIHYEACEEARPDPSELARRLFHWQIQGDSEAFSCAAENYSEILGAKGMKVYRELAEAEWEKVAARTAGQGRPAFGEYSRIKEIMESLARASGDIEQLVTMMSRDLSDSYRYWKVVEVYSEANQPDQALAWAEKGLQAFPDYTGSRLREFAANEYHRRGRHEEGMKLMWAEFADQPHLRNFQTLERHAKQADAWPLWRERALEEIRRRIAKAKEKAGAQTRPRWLPAGDDSSPLVEIFLYEGNTDEAWREAQAGGCWDGLWLRLADARETEHPEDAAAVYLKMGEAGVAAVGTGRYEDAVDLLVKAASAMRRAGRAEEFTRRLETLRSTYGLKRNFIKLVEQNRSSLYL